MMRIAGWFFFLLYSLPLFPATPALLINELLASNASINADGANEYDDWIEIYNASNQEVDISGMYLGNGGENKWEIAPSDTQQTTIPAKGFLVIWCDKDTEQGNLHADFKLDADGEAVYLIDRDGSTIIDSIGYPQQYLDFSYGRIAQGKQLTYFLKPTPWTGNDGNEAIREICAPATFSTPGGFYHDSVEVTLVVPTGTEVYYTLNGNIPGKATATKYTKPVSVTKTTVLRARAFRDGFLPGALATQTFFINEKISVPVVSMSVTQDDLWGDHGIYVQPFLDMEKAAHFEFFHENSPKVNMPLGVSIFGNTSRNSSKQSFTLRAREKFGNDQITYSFFSDYPDVKKFDGIILRGDVTSGRGGGDRETAGERVKNELMYHFIKESGGNVDVQAYQPVVLFINGAYWGLYNLMERKNKDFIKNHYGIDDIDILASDNLKTKEGDREDYLELLAYMEEHDLEEDEKFSFIEKKIDTKSLMDYWIFETYSATHDYEVNIRMWRPRTPEGKWRWFAYDEDSWGRPDEETLHEFTEETYAESIFIIGQMLENQKFRQQFINRLCDLLNTVLHPDSVKRLIDKIQAEIRREKERDYNRWKNLVHFVEPGSQIAYLKEFAEFRPSFLRQEMIKRFELNDSTILTLEVEGQGTIRLNTIHVDAFPWTGIYFQQVPVTLTAVPAAGLRFAGWSDAALPKEENIVVTITGKEYKLKAKFE